MTLPPEGSAVERNRLDCKAKYTDGDKRRFEMAKDVAAFANANGGTLLIGSVESGGILTKHVGLTSADAMQTRRDIEEAVRDYVRPTPVIDFPEPVELEPGKVVLLVDVQPFPGQAVGVHSGKADEEPWRFPVRVGTQTVWYSPEQLVFLMDVHHRRKAQLLFQAMGEKCSIHGAHGFMHVVDVVDVKPTENVFRIHVSKTSKPIDLPIDVVKMVWKTEHQWCIRLHGQVIIRGGAALQGAPTVAVYVETEAPVS